MDYKEKVIAILNSQELSKEQKEKLEEIFPELREDEDEKIRKELIHLVKKSNEYGGYALHKWEADRMLAWLEKQEQKYSWSYEDEANLNNIIWLCNNCINCSETTWIPSQATKIKHLIETIKERGLGYQKSTEWNKEDDNCLSTIIAEFSKCAGKSVSKDEWMRCNDFLNSLKDRVCPKQEWGEEDESMYTRTLGILGKCYMGELPTKVEEELKWFKSLRQR